jgi:hypothetical protein
MENKKTKETKYQLIRQLRKRAPLAAVDKYISGSDIYVLEQENKIIAAYVL